MKTQQASMFGNDGADLPLFSGTAQRVTVRAHKPEVAHRQESLASCPVCKDTGSIINKVCMCPAGAALRAAHRKDA